MNKEELESIYKERRLLKELYSLNVQKYSHLKPTIDELKIKINSEYKVTSEVSFALYDFQLAERIKGYGIEYLNELNEKIKL